MNDLASWALSVYAMERSLSCRCREFDNYKFGMVAAGDLWDLLIKFVTEEQSYCKLGFW